MHVCLGPSRYREQIRIHPGSGCLSLTFGIMKHLFIIFLIATILSACKPQLLVQKSSSMEPTIAANENLVSDLSAYASSKPSRWDVVIFDPPDGKGIWAFRVVGLPGEIIEFSNDTLKIDGQSPSYPKDLKIVYDSPPTLSSVSFPYTVPENSYFVLGDNTKNANDSRYWGAIPFSKIRGKVLLK